ncbi:SPOR domain-containing protein [Acidovorax sp. NCPPB 3859]|nr:MULTISPECIES: SPOR domain-containing protein [unclassified Acidovorax]MDA8450410.1 SPOR domain-containing protein [Acidovorax sp. GBBC 3297]MDA8459916.1 SPOR domain-containing protein [Acidovorax sp. GBBC 3333]MDA8464952.1 SPOR domain-containing protein [Acidovorax sp. GBBC 3332]MDA8469925.1 SPOR domain-containing protein [Acidovorax sp. GBBC 3299]WCM77479.1 SPOR domain-containing protein [Acidovorax sp. GBBC 712]
MSAPSAYAVTAATTARRSTESTMAALYRAALGPIGAARYMPAFERFDEAGRTLPGWNWTAALLTLNWMVFRQLWSAALVYVAALEGLALLAVGVGRYTGTWPLPVLAGLGLAVLLAATVIPGLYGNAIVHGEIRKRITKALAASATLAQAQERLEENAPTQRRLIWIGAANAVLALLLAALLLFQPDLSAMGPAKAAHAPPAAAEGPRASASTAQAPASDAPPLLPGDASAAGTAGPASVPVAAAPTSAPSAAEPTDGASRPSTPSVQASASASSGAAAPPSSSPAATSLPTPPRQTASAAPRATASPAPAASSASPAVVPASAASSASSPTVPGNASARSPAASAPASARPVQAPASAASRRTAAPMASRPAAPATADRTDSAAVPARKLYINVGLFAEPANAQRAHGMLRGAGIPAATQPVTAADGRELLRVRAGPFTSASQANAAASRIRALGLETSAAAAQRP